MNDYFLRILAKQRHEQILTEFNTARHLQREPPRVSRWTWLIGIFRHFIGQRRRPIAFRPVATDERNKI